MELSIIIVNYNVKEFLQNLIHSLQKAVSKINHEIIVVDNASDDGSVEFIREKFPHINLIVNKTNLGFSKANNIALKASKGKFILLINPDTIVSENTITKMVEFLNVHPNAGLAGCKILNPDGSLQLACRRSFPGPWTSFCKVTGLSTLFPKSKLFARYNLTYLDEDSTHEVDAISGSFMMMKREVYEKVGGFDEQFFMYGEDLDLCYRVQQSGYKVYYYPGIQIIHYKGESTKRSGLDETKYFYDAMNLFVKKHFSTFYLVEIILRSAIGFRKFFAFLGQRKLIFTGIILDIVFFNASLILAEKLYLRSTSWGGFPEFSYPLILIIPAAIHVVVAALIGVYRKNSFSVLRNTGAIVISFFIISSLTFFFKQFAYSRAVVIITYIFLLVSLAAWRIILKLFFKVGLEIASSSKRTLIVGTNKTAINIADKLQKKFIDDHIIQGLIGYSHKDIGNAVAGYEIVGSLDNINKLIMDKKINEVIFSPDELSYNQMMSIVSKNKSAGVDFKLIGSNLDFLVGKASVSVLDDIPLIDINLNISSFVSRFIKLLMDLTLGLFALIFIYPLIYLISRADRKQSDFRKFILGIPSIFSGRVSLVGPKHQADDSKIFLGKKGLTGLWYLENDSANSGEKLDLIYARNQNIWLDLEILGKTFNKMFINKR
ncbi:MAG: glycosyl transferase [Ignavibacteria bacterium RBG_16_35_7]|nr:MAG: glycosyl transferase [Ignavibacteria bacterium RBG_16_35_7]